MNQIIGLFSEKIQKGKSNSKKKNQLYQCRVTGCKKIYTNYRSFKYHMISHNGVKAFVCPLKGFIIKISYFLGCNKSYLTKSLLNRHIKLSK